MLSYNNNICDRLSVGFSQKITSFFRNVAQRKRWFLLACHADFCMSRSTCNPNFVELRGNADSHRVAEEISPKGKPVKNHYQGAFSFNIRHEPVESEASTFCFFPMRTTVRSYNTIFVAEDNALRTRYCWPLSVSMRSKTS